jgi:hypothetical protein
MVRIAIALAVMGLVLAGCGRDPNERFTLKTPPEHVSAGPLASIKAQRARTAAIVAARPTRADARAAAHMLRRWTRALRENHDEAAARFFDPPVFVAQGAVMRLGDRSEVARFNAAIPCGLKLLRVEPQGRFLVGTFRLARRTAHDCARPGTKQRLAFAVQKGKIVELRQAPDDPHASPGPALPEDAPHPPSRAA